MNNLVIKKVLILAFVFIVGYESFGQGKNLVLKKYEKEVQKMVRNKAIGKAFEVIEAEEPRTIENLITLTEIPAPPFLEEKRAQKLKELFEECGADSVWIDEVGNVLALKKGKSGVKNVVLDAHLDTVFPIDTDVRVKKRGDTLIAPGIGDDTRGLDMLVTILKAVNTAEIITEANILFVGTVGEEGLGDLRGVKHLFRENADIKIDSWISIDGGGVGRVNIGALGSKRYRAVFEGPGGHSWGAFGLANPHHALGKAIEYFEKAASEYTSEGPKTSFNIGRIGGGTSVNSIPFQSWFEVDMRSLDPDRLLVIDSIFQASVKKAVVDYNSSGVEDEVTLKLEKIGDRPSGKHPTDLPLVQRAIAATEEFGHEPRLTTGSTNSNIPISMGIPAVTIGRGGQGGNAHSLDEWWANMAGARAIKLALLITVLEAGLGG